MPLYTTKKLTITLLCTLPFLTAQADDIIIDDLIIEGLEEELLDDIEFLEEIPAPAIAEQEIKEVIETDNSAQETETPEARPVNVSEDVKVNLVRVQETFNKLVFDADTNSYTKLPTSEAKPGDLIEIVVTAHNTSDQPVDNVGMINSIPSGPISLLRESITVNESRSFYRISRNGDSFFPSDAEMATSDIRFIQWVISNLDPNESQELSYRIKINR